MSKIVLGKLYVFHYLYHGGGYCLYPAPFPAQERAFFSNKVVFTGALVVPLVHKIDYNYESIYVFTDNQLAGWIIKITDQSSSVTLRPFEGST